MDNRRLPLTRRALLFAAALSLPPAGRAMAAASPGTGGWTKVVSAGFTSRNNSYAPWSVEFREQLYVATSANAAGELYSGSRKRGGDIWRSADGIAWQQLGEPGLGNPNSATFNLVVFKDRLYALSNTINAGGSEIWVSDDGASFSRIMTGGFGDAANTWLQGFSVSDRLIVAVSGGTGSPQFQVSEDGNAFRMAASRGLAGGGNTGISLMGPPPLFAGHVYVGTSNPAAGGEIWRSADGLGWERVAEKGLARAANTSLTPMAVFDGQLFALGMAAGRLDALRGLDIYRTRDGTTWERVVADGFAQGPERNVTGTVVPFAGRLYVAANSMDPRLLIPGQPKERHAPQGFQLWSTADGDTWQKTGDDGFGRATALHAAFDVVGGTAYLTAFDYHQGTRIWQSRDGQAWEIVFEEPKPSMFAEGGGVLAFKNHLLWFDNDLALGVEAWRRQAAETP